ncbi:MAG: SPFH domain-containing protein [Eubacterium sp.]|nr:SPFH domain-containing protein [Eubacterium sp.]
MGFIQAFVGAAGGTLADQWIDVVVPADAPGTAGIIPGVMQGTNAGRGSNYKGSEGIITNGSKIRIPDGYALITLQDNAVTGFVAEPGGYTFTSDDPNAKSIFTGGGLVEGVIKQAWERFKYGGQPGSSQQAIFVNLKEIPNNRFGTQSEIYWDDMYINAQVGAMVRGTYTLKITDPISFIKNFVPVKYVTGGEIFDFADMDNEAGDQLFNEVVSSLGAAFSNYTNDPSRGNRMNKIQGDQIGFAQSLSAAVEEAYQWKSDRGLEIAKVAIAAIEYDEDSKQLLSDVKKADALSGARGNSFMQQSVARGMEAAGSTQGAMGMGVMGMGLGAVGNGVAGLQQPVGGMAVGANANMGMQQGMGMGMQQGMPQQGMPQQAAPAEDPVAKMKQMKDLLDAGVISQEEFDAAKAKYLGI